MTAAADTMLIQCAKCEREVSGAAAYCPVCGSSVEASRPKLSLQSAVEAGNLDEVRAHIRWKTDLNAFDRAKDVNDSPLLVSALNHGHKEIAKALINAGIDLNRNDEVWGTPLLSACRDAEMVEILLGRGADINTKPPGLSPLGAAAGYGDLRIAELLLAKGALLNPDESDLGPLHEAVKKEKREMVDWLLSRGANLEHKSSRVYHGGTPLHAAASAGLPEMVEHLLAKGANPNAINKKGNTPLQVATRLRDESTSNPDYKERYDRVVAILEKVVPATANNAAPTASIQHAPARPVKRSWFAKLFMGPPLTVWNGVEFRQGDRVQIKSIAGANPPDVTGHHREVQSGPGQVGTVVRKGFGDTLLIRWDAQQWQEWDRHAMVSLGSFEDTIHTDYLRHI